MSFVLNKIMSMQWAITEDALDAIVNLATREWTAADYDIFHKASKDEKLAIVSLLGEPVDGSNNAFVIDDTGFLMFDGPVIPKAGFMSAASGMISLDSMTADFKAFESDPNIARIVGLFDSPGGNVVGVSEFASMVKACKKQTLAHGFGSVASAAFWIFSAFEKRTAVDTSLLGSIGVISKISKDDDDEGTLVTVSSQSAKKNPDLESKEGQEQIQKMVDGLADVFVETVAKNYVVTAETVITKFGQGGVLVAKEALQAGMIDKITTLDSLLSRFTQPNPAMGGEKRRGLEMTTLAEFLAANPAEAAKYERERAEEQAKEEAKQKAEAKKTADIEFATKYLGSEYDAEIQKMAAGVVTGETTVEALRIAASTHDKFSEQIKTLQAQIETLTAGGTAPGVDLNDMQREEAEDNAIRAQMGMKPLELEA